MDYKKNREGKKIYFVNKKRMYAGKLISDIMYTVHIEALFAISIRIQLANVYLIILDAIS